MVWGMTRNAAVMLEDMSFLWSCGVVKVEEIRGSNTKQQLADDSYRFGGNFSKVS